ncbi:YdcF family protein [Altericroceibacterium xinjiangense]|uniref:YdcF family protein n=1 Tax=Altericroceibacterium xinjiangense TaxID=762261 RepID=UPI000F7E6CE7|nr:YdcF family protein [Altericroceibacterium xinjiangense]
MIRRLLATLLVAWVFGFLWFAVALPLPAGLQETDAIVVPTGSGGRIERGLSLLRQGTADHMLVTGVGLDVKPQEFAAIYGASDTLMDCCITLGFDALDTRGNARETAAWMDQKGFQSLRLVTSDWHMRRTALELEQTLPSGTGILLDAVQTQPSLWILFLEYNKLLAAAAVWALDRI